MVVDVDVDVDVAVVVATASCDASSGGWLTKEGTKAFTASMNFRLGIVFKWPAMVSTMAGSQYRRSVACKIPSCNKYSCRASSSFTINDVFNKDHAMSSFVVGTCGGIDGGCCGVAGCDDGETIARWWVAVAVVVGVVSGSCCGCGVEDAPKEAVGRCETVDLACEVLKDDAAGALLGRPRGIFDSLLALALALEAAVDDEGADADPPPLLRRKYEGVNIFVAPAAVDERTDCC